MQARLAQGGAEYGVPITMATTLRRDPAGNQLQLAMNVQVPGAVTGPLVTMFGVVDDAGKMVQVGRKELQAPQAGDDYRVAFPVVLPEGRYRVRILATDTRGAIGAIEQAVTVRLARLGSFSASDLLTTWTDASGARRLLGLDTLPAIARTIGVSLEMYPETPASSADGLTIRLALLREGDDQPMVERNLSLTASGGHLSASADMETAAWEPGTYTVRATLLEAGVVTGTVKTSIRKQ
jgi:hypothetical protein